MLAQYDHHHGKAAHDGGVLRTLRELYASELLRILREAHAAELKRTLREIYTTELKREYDSALPMPEAIRRAISE
jgi:hypothetical protein